MVAKEGFPRKRKREAKVMVGSLLEMPSREEYVNEESKRNAFSKIEDATAPPNCPKLLQAAPFDHPSWFHDSSLQQCSSLAHFGTSLYTPSPQA